MYLGVSSYFQKNIVFFCLRLKIVYTFKNSVDPDDMHSSWSSQFAKELITNTVSQIQRVIFNLITKSSSQGIHGAKK